MVTTPIANLMQERPKLIDGPVRPAVGRQIEEFAEEHPEEFVELRRLAIEKGGRSLFETVKQSRS